ncbi:unnamed protein product [Paramecium pentaurelia]|uniref:Uncharacterized protein n=1 Tax=Paramecium pentaurelia TaxID=43138 RepID=A0A8S1RTR2_9CILI|nr:unnamed protein product [Paramecium pentaurelia]
MIKQNQLLLQEKIILYHLFSLNQIRLVIQIRKGSDKSEEEKQKEKNEQQDKKDSEELEKKEDPVKQDIKIENFSVLFTLFSGYSLKKEKELAMSYFGYQTGRKLTAEEYNQYLQEKQKPLEQKGKKISSRNWRMLWLVN